MTDIETTATPFSMPAWSAPVSYRNVPPPYQLYSNEIPQVNHLQIQWSVIESSPAHIEKLRLLCHSQKELKKEAYILNPLSEDQIQAKSRCIKCNSASNHPNVLRTQLILCRAGTS